MTPREAPRVLMLVGPGDPPWPELDAVRERARLSLASDAEALASELPEAEVVLLADFRTRALREAWPRAKHLRWIHAASAGVDRLMFPEFRESDVLLTNARGIFDRPIAEYVLGCILAFAKDFLGNLTHQRAHRWHYRESRSIEGRRLLVYGAGSIGTEIACLARAAGMRAVGIARRARPHDPDFEAVREEDALFEELPRADYVAIAAPLTEATRHRFDAQAFACMDPEAVLVNVGRGAIVDTEALVEALRSRRLRGAALDVFEEEPLPPDHPLWSFENVMLSAHQAGDVVGWRGRVMQDFLANLDRWIAGEPLENVVCKRRGYGAS